MLHGKNYTTQRCASETEKTIRTKVSKNMNSTTFTITQLVKLGTALKHFLLVDKKAENNAFVVMFWYAVPLILGILTT